MHKSLAWWLTVAQIFGPSLGYPCHHWAILAIMQTAPIDCHDQAHLGVSWRVACTLLSNCSMPSGLGQQVHVW